MRKTRRWDEEPEREPGRPRKPSLGDLDPATRGGVVEDLQRGAGNSALQQVMGARLQRDLTPTRLGRDLMTGFAVSIGGTSVPVRSVEGGSIRAEIATGREGPTGLPDKHPVNVEFDPVTLEVGANANELGSWIAKSLDGNFLRQDLTVHQMGASGMQSLELHQALVTSFGLPELKTNATDPVWLRVKVQPEYARRRTGSDTNVQPAGVPEALNASTTRLEITGVGEVAELQSVAPWQFRQNIKPFTVGESRTPQIEATSREFGNLGLTVGEGRGADALTKWAERSMVQGDRDERKAVLTISGKRGKLELTFSGVGIMSAELLKSSGRNGRRFELYVERAALKLG